MQAGSPAIDDGDPGSLLDVVGPANFRGLARIVSGRVDIGAHEAQ